MEITQEGGAASLPGHCLLFSALPQALNPVDVLGGGRPLGLGQASGVTPARGPAALPGGPGPG